LLDPSKCFRIRVENVCVPSSEPRQATAEGTRTLFDRERAVLEGYAYPLRSRAGGARGVRVPSRAASTRPSRGTRTPARVNVLRCGGTRTPPMLRKRGVEGYAYPPSCLDAVLEGVRVPLRGAATRVPEGTRTPPSPRRGTSTHDQHSAFAGATSPTTSSHTSRNRSPSKRCSRVSTHRTCVCGGARCRFISNASGRGSIHRSRGPCTLSPPPPSRACHRSPSPTSRT
jgi:hypothetical protein